MKVYYGLTSHTQLKRSPRDIDVMLSARWLIKKSSDSVVWSYIKEFKSWFLDSGAFGSFFYDGGFNITLDQYIDFVDRVKPDYWISMDMPCEPHIIQSPLNTHERIEFTIDNTKILAKTNLPGFVPVIQGWTVDDYLYCANRMKFEGLIRPYMAVGSLCRRGSQKDIVAILAALKQSLPHTQFHGLGTKINALIYNNGEAMNYLDSLDTSAWQFRKLPSDQGGSFRPQSWSQLIQSLTIYREKS